MTETIEPQPTGTAASQKISANSIRKQSTIPVSEFLDDYSRRVVNLMLSHREVMERCEAQKLTFEFLDAQYQRLARVALDVWKQDKVLLTRRTYLNINEASKNYTKHQLCVEEGLWNKCRLLMAGSKPDDFPGLCRVLSERTKSEGGAAARIRHAIRNPICLDDHFAQAPEIVQRLARLMYTLSGGMAPAHYMSALSILSAMVGKKLVGRNRGRDYYANHWLVILAPTAAGKSFIGTVEKLCREVSFTSPNCPYDVMQARFTMAYAYMELGRRIKADKWSAMTEGEQIEEKRKILEECKAKRARVIFSDEFAYTFSKVIGSGTPDGELGAVLQLADSGATISGSTATDGYRIIEDACVSMIGYSQPTNWQKFFDVAQNVDTGLIGRFMIMDVNDYTLNIEKLPLNGAQVRDEIANLLRQAVCKTGQLPERLVVDFDPDQKRDRMGEVFDRLLATDPFRLFSENGSIDFSKVRGKVIYQALKYTMVDRFLSMPEADLKKTSGNVFGDGEAPEWPALVDWAVYESYLRLLLNNIIKVFTAELPMSESEQLEVKIFNMLQAEEKGMISLRDIVRKNLKLDGRVLKTWDARDIVYGMQERQIVAVEELSKGSIIVRLTGRPLRFEGMVQAVLGGG